VLQGRTVKIETREPTLAAMLDDVEMVAAHDVTVMLVGETGSGKTTLAKLFHELSPRFDKSFLHVACGALPPTLIESELFGHIRGAFTGADRPKIGKFEAAGEGTILLDEIDTLSLEQQVKLLRVIESREFEPVGSNETRFLKARLIVASNVCLETLVETGRFRQDLYYRLNVLKFNLAPLRERAFDVTPLAMEFVQHAAKKCGIVVRGVHPQFIAALRAYHWPGNLRELNNCMERSVVLCRSGVLTPSCLPPAVLRVERPVHRTAEESVAAAAPTLPDQVSASERTIIEEALRRHGYRRSPAAQELGVSRVTLYNKMKKHGLLSRTRKGESVEPAST
jgi:transcriptional regulator with PAS, ATPase and Fis domain